MSGFACGESYPSRTPRIIVGFAAGGPNDILARLIGQWLSQRLGELREAQLVEKDPAGSYRLTEPGSRLLARLDGMDQWTQEWVRRLARPTTGRPGGSD